MTNNLAVDLSPHLSTLARHREEERLAGRFRPDDTSSPNLIQLDGGAPSPAYFPFETISAQYLKPTAFPVNPSAAPTTTGLCSNSLSLQMSNLTIEKHSANLTETFDLAKALSYSPPNGLAPIGKFVYNFVRDIYKPSYADWGTLVNLGSGDALTKALDVVSEPGDGCFVDEWSYNGSLVKMRPIGIKPIPVKMDSGGLDPTDLERILANWDTQTRGCKRPRLLLQVPVGQNPTGTTLTSARKKVIYDICVKWDLIILEDDPYYFLQTGSYVAPTSRDEVYETEETDKEWVDSLVPSFLRHDYQGRVIRLDTFSKIIGPGGRFGFFTASKYFIHHLRNAQSGRSTAPSGLSQSLYGSLLLQWGQDGFIRWLRGLRGLYRMRRDWALDLLHEYFDMSEVPEDGRQVFLAFAKTPKAEPRANGVEHLPEQLALARKSLVRFVPPSAGMFIWFQFDLQQHPDFAVMNETGSLREARNTLSQKLFDALLKAEVILRPGFVFQGQSDAERDAAHDTYAYMRLAFSKVEYDQLRTAIQRIAQVLQKFFHAHSLALNGANDVVNGAH